MVKHNYDICASKIITGIEKCSYPAFLSLRQLKPSQPIHYSRLNSHEFEFLAKTVFANINLRIRF